MQVQLMDAEYQTNQGKIVQRDQHPIDGRRLAFGAKRPLPSNFASPHSFSPC